MAETHCTRRMALAALAASGIDLACFGGICRSQTPQRNQDAAAPSPVRWSAAQRERFRTSQQTAAQLRAASERSLHRGLLPLVDMLRQQRAAGELELRLAALTGDATAQVSTLQTHAEVLARSVAHLRTFRQPAAEHWGAELALAELLSARAQGDLSRARGNLQAARAAESSIPQHARQLFRWRVFDDRVGIAGLPEVALATGELINSDPAFSGKDNPLARAALEKYRAQLQRHVQQTERWKEVGAGIGRPDRSALASFQLAQLDMLLASNSDNPGNAASLRTALHSADAAAADMFAEQWAFSQSGTASLADLTHAWMLRDQVHRGAEALDAPLGAASRQAQAENLEQLSGAADRTPDRRGRHEADVLLVGALRDIVEWRSLEKAVKAAPREAPKSSDTPGSPKSRKSTEDSTSAPDSTAEGGDMAVVEALNGERLLRRYYPRRILDFTSGEPIGRR